MPYRENTSHLSYEHLQASLIKAGGAEFKLKITPNKFRMCHAWAKLATPLVPSTLNMVNNKNEKTTSAILAMLES